MAEAGEYISIDIDRLQIGLYITLDLKWMEHPFLTKSFKIKDSIKGVIVTSVDPGSPAAERGLRPGDVIEEVNHQAVGTPSDVAKAIDAAKKDVNKKPALLLVSNGEGVARFVALPVN